MGWGAILNVGYVLTIDNLGKIYKHIAQKNVLDNESLDYFETCDILSDIFKNKNIQFHFKTTYGANFENEQVYLCYNQLETNNNQKSSLGGNSYCKTNFNALIEDSEKIKSEADKFLSLLSDDVKNDINLELSVIAIYHDF